MQFIFELLLPIFELVFYPIGYATAWLIVPIFTFGRVTVEPGPAGRSVKPNRGPYVLDADVAVCIGILFWIVVAVGVYLIGRAA